MKKEGIHVLIISFFFAPDKRVGALRTSYWHRQLPTIEGFKTSVITANPEASGENVYIVPQVAQPSKWSPIKDEGVTWKKEVKNFLSTHPIDADAVIITGSPFMHFGMAKWLKKHLNCKVILDYRDPFATNPGFNNSRFKVLVKKYYERKFNRMADALITVNKYCGIIISQFYDMPNRIVQNGYDETITPELKEIDLKNPKLCYTGKFYFDPKPIISALDTLNLTLDYAGMGGDKIHPSMQNVNNFGLIPYSQAVELTANSDIAIIQTMGEDFVSTTKIFDYIRCKRVILIVSDNYLERGSIHEELKGYPNVYWTKNDESSIMKAIAKIQQSSYIEPDQQYCNSFSRREQMNKLVELIQILIK